MTTIANPILQGFNPDPSILRVENDYYIATSTFEWFPGVQIHHSRDLVNWRLLSHPLDRVSQLDMKGCPDSAGVWAPCLTYDQGTFYLVYTDVKSWNGIFKDTHNYLVTAPSILGPWSEPTYLNSTGFDPSLFHDDDGRKWLVNMSWDFRREKNKFGGILLQEFDPVTRRLFGPVRNIFLGTALKSTEGPHLYRFHSRYYLLTAEGGTGLGHAVSMARSDTLFGPYEVDPQNPLLTSADSPDSELKKAGHGDLVETQDGQLYLVHLCGRPTSGNGRCTLGRETAIQKVCWNSEGWLRLEAGGTTPLVEVSAPGIAPHPWPAPVVREEFDGQLLGMDWQTLRIPLEKRFASTTERPGYLRLRGQESLSSKHRQTIVARRQQAFAFVASTVLEFHPESYRQMAGLICYYDTRNFFYLRVSNDDVLGKNLTILQCNEGQFSYPSGKEILLNTLDPVFLRVTIDHDQLQFFHSRDSKAWATVGPVLDCSILSDEYDGLGFTGTFVGLCCQDLAGTDAVADFDWFEYRELL